MVGGGGRGTPSVFSSRLSVAKGRFQTLTVVHQSRQPRKLFAQILEFKREILHQIGACETRCTLLDRHGQRFLHELGTVERADCRDHAHRDQVVQQFGQHLDPACAPKDLVCRVLEKAFACVGCGQRLVKVKAHCTSDRLEVCTRRFQLFAFDTKVNMQSSIHTKCKSQHGIEPERGCRGNLACAG